MLLVFVFSSPNDRYFYKPRLREMCALVMMWQLATVMEARSSNWTDLEQLLGNSAHSQIQQQLCWLSISGKMYHAGDGLHLTERDICPQMFPEHGSSSFRRKFWEKNESEKRKHESRAHPHLLACSQKWLMAATLAPGWGHSLFIPLGTNSDSRRSHQTRLFWANVLEGEVYVKPDNVLGLIFMKSEAAGTSINKLFTNVREKAS